MLLHRWLPACAMHHLNKAFYRPNRREQSRVPSSRNRHSIRLTSTRIGRFRILLSCRRWWNELSIVGLLPTRIRTIWHPTSSRRTVATIPRKRHLFDVLNHRFDIRDAALTWFHAYFDERSQVVKVGSDESRMMKLSTGVPQGSVLSPRSFVYYAEDVQEIFRREELSYHLFADDMQGHRSSRPQDAARIVASLQDCIIAVSNWCASKRLQLNAKKTEVLWFGSVAGLRKVDAADRRLTVGTDVIQPVEVVRNLGVYFDSHLTMKAHVARVARTCFYHLRRLRSIRRSLGHDVTARLVSALVI